MLAQKENSDMDMREHLGEQIEHQEQERKTTTEYEHHDGNYFVREIKSHYKRSVEDIVKIGELLLEAHLRVATKVWRQTYLPQLPFGEAMASKYQTIAEFFRKRKEYLDRMPASIDTLYAIAVLDKHSLKGSPIFDWCI